MKRTFIEVEVFKKLLDQEGLKNLEKDIKDEILKNPKKGDVISGTGGVRKIRIANRRDKRGKSGSFRVIYYDLEEFEVTYLLMLFSKGRVENISQEQKKKIRLLVEALKNEHKNKKN